MVAKEKKKKCVEKVMWSIFSGYRYTGDRQNGCVGCAISTAGKIWIIMYEIKINKNVIITVMYLQNYDLSNSHVRNFSMAP